MTDVTVIDAGAIIAGHRKWFTFLGIALIVAGVLSIIFPFAGGLATAVWIAAAFIISGIAQVIHAFAARGWQGFLLGLLVGLLYLAAGVMLWLDPLGGLVTLTVLLAVVLLIDGVLRAIMAFQLRPINGWWLLLLGGIVGILAGLMIWRQLPSSAIWAIGLLVGINMVFSGVAFTGLARSARPSL